jgi:hypothetical protein
VALVDGSVVSAQWRMPLVVTDGAADPSRLGTKITVGLPLRRLIETLPAGDADRRGWNVARPQQAGRSSCGSSTPATSRRARMESAVPGQAARVRAYGDPMALKTGDFDVNMAGTSGNETVVVVNRSDPTPMHIAAILIEPQAGDLT